MTIAQKKIWRVGNRKAIKGKARCRKAKCERAVEQNGLCRPCHYAECKAGKKIYKSRKRKCNIDGCSKPYFSRGMCSAHYKKASRSQGGGVVPNAERKVKICKEEGCSEEAKAKGLCIAHYSALRYLHLRMKGKARVRPLKGPRKPTEKKLCKADGCDKDSLSKGMCLNHYRASRKPVAQLTEKKRKRINPVSSKRRAWNDKYFAQVEKDEAMQRPVDQPDKLYSKDNSYQIQRHHPYRRLGEHILLYVYVSSRLHTHIEDHGKWSREVGWIHDHPPQPNDLRAWPASSEKHWPEKYRRDYGKGIE